MAKKDKGDNPGGLFIPGGLLVGMGVGFLVEDLVPWLFIGLGAGFFFLAFSMMAPNDK